MNGWKNCTRCPNSLKDLQVFLWTRAAPRILSRMLVLGASVAALVVPPTSVMADPCVAWQQVSNTGPSPRYLPITCYDSANEVTVLFGGYDGAHKNDTWLWDGNTWTEVNIGGTAPPARYGAGMAFDSVRNKAVLFGGFGSGTPQPELNDTWEWNGATQTWTEIPGAGGPARALHAMSFDSRTGTTVLFGGVAQYPASHDDTWLYNGVTWNEYCPTCDAPSRRGFVQMIYDSARDEHVLVGGNQDNLTTFQDTWAFRLPGGPAPIGWTQLANGMGPSARFGYGLAYDSGRNVTVLFGGAGNGQNLGETWEWDGASWEQQDISEPPARRYTSMAFDSARQVCVLFGGRGGIAGPNDYNLGDTWEYGPNAACDDGDACTVNDVCSDGLCAGTFECRVYGDVAPAYCVVDVDDILYVLDGFADPPSFPNADIEPCVTGDGDVDVDDILGVLDAFSGNALCSDPCPP